jgi:hypothetical protein
MILRKRLGIHSLALAIILVTSIAGADPALQPGSALDLSGMPSVGGRNFDASALPHSAFLVFASSRQNADQTRRWGDAIGARFKDKLAKWTEEHGQPISIVPVLDLSSARFMPQSVVAAVVKMMGGGNDVLLDWKGFVSQKVGAPSSEAAVILTGPDLKVQSIVTGEYSPAAAAPLFAALEADAK